MRQLGWILRVLWVGVTLTVTCAADAKSGQAVDPSFTGDRTNVVAEVVKLLRAGTDPTVVAGFIQQWPEPYLTSVDDLRALRQAGATEIILNAFAKRGAELRLRASLDRTHRSTAAATNAPTTLFYPERQSRPNFMSLEPEAQGSLYPFSDALWWWANLYPYPVDPYPPWGAFPFRRHPR